jgi:beta-glucosidase/6-phospho-beta-glucosidase/beta-galactosidase
MEEALQDNDRVNYFKGITNALKGAMLEDGVDVRAYFPWSMYCSHQYRDKFSYVLLFYPPKALWIISSGESGEGQL